MKHAELGRLKHWLSVLLPMLGLVTLPNLAVLDLELSAYFYDEQCKCFPAAVLGWVHRFDWIIAWLGRLALPVILLLMLLLWFRLAGGRQASDRLERVIGLRRVITALRFMALLGVLTPMVLIHEVLKPEIGRARPRDVAQFAGTQVFTPAWVKSTACTKNCSFTSGHVAFGAWVMSGWYLGRRRRWLWLCFGGALTMAIGWSRMAQGAHFFTDVIGSCLLVWLTAHLISMIALFRSR